MDKACSVAVIERRENAHQGSSCCAGRRKKRYGERPQPDTGEDELQLAGASPALPKLPDEVWALIFGKFPNGWYYSHDQATVCQQFKRVAAEWKGRVCETTSFDFRQGSSRSMRKRFMELARRCGNYVKDLVLMGEYFTPVTSRPRISTNTVVEGLKLMPNLAVLDLSMCFTGRDITILDAILEFEHLRDVRVTVAARPKTYPRDYSFNFTEAAMNTLVSITVKMALHLTIVGWYRDDTGINELLQRIQARAGNLQSLQVFQVPVLFSTALCGTTPANISRMSEDCSHSLAFDLMSSSFPFLQRLVLRHLCLKVETVLEILKKNPQITQLGAGIDVADMMSPDDGYDAEFIETFSRLENKFTFLDISCWQTAAPCDVLVKMAACFKSLRQFSYRFRTHRVCHDSGYLRDGNEHSAQMLVSACPNLSSLTIGGAIGVPGLRRKDLLCRKHRSCNTVLPENFGELATLGKLSRLRSLSLCRMSLRSEADLESFASQCPQLECLHLSAINAEHYIPRLNAVIRKLPNLKALTLDHANVEQHSFFESLAKLTQLEHFSLRTEETIFDRTLINFLESSLSPLNFVHIVCVGPAIGLKGLIQRLSASRPNSRLRVKRSLRKRDGDSAHKGFKQLRWTGLSSSE